MKLWIVISCQVIETKTSFHSALHRTPGFHLGHLPNAPRKPDREAPVEEIVANHTAIKPSRALCGAFAVESLITGVPLLVVDLLLTGGGLLLASWIVNLAHVSSVTTNVWKQMPALLALQWLMMSMHQLYPGAGVSPIAELRGIVRSTVFSLLCLSVMNVLLGQLPRSEFLVFTCTALIVSMMLPIARWSTRNLLGRTKWWGIRLLLVGRRDDCVPTFNQLRNRRSSGFIPTGYTCDLEDAAKYTMEDRWLLGVNCDAASIARKYMAPVAGLVSPESDSGQTERLIFQFPSVVWIDFATSARNNFDTSNLPQVFRTRLNMPFLRFVPRMVKRGTDLAVAVPTLLALSVPMLLITCIIKIVSPGPAFFGHKRIGQHGSTFRAWKFRTMVMDADAVLEKHLQDNPDARAEWERDQKLRNDPRILGVVGRFLRKWSLDELPQLWNVLVGEMSLVGPRPIVYDEIAKYSRGYLAYSHMMPGITGLWQVSGRNNTTYETRVSMDEHYARNWSPWLDFWVLIKTPAVVITRNGAY